MKIILGYAIPIGKKLNAPDKLRWDPSRDSAYLRPRHVGLSTIFKISDEPQDFQVVEVGPFARGNFMSDRSRRTIKVSRCQQRVDDIMESPFQSCDGFVKIDLLVVKIST